MNQQFTTKVAVLLAMFGQLVAQGRPLQAAPPSNPRKTAAASRSQNPDPIADVALDSSGVLRGQVLNAEGQAVPFVPVIADGKGVASRTTVTDDQGRFQMKLDRGGIYRLQAAGGTAMYRVWSSQAAPPVAGCIAMIVAGDSSVRGQGSPAYGWISEHPWCFYTLLATAIAVPVVIVSANHDDDSSS
jgi:hypothetical protein